MNQQVVEDLITLKKLYQLQQAEIEREKGHAIGQLSHINALLVDQMVGEQRFIESLAELRNRYQEQAGGVVNMLILLTTNLDLH